MNTTIGIVLGLLSAIGVCLSLAIRAIIFSVSPGGTFLVIGEDTKESRPGGSGMVVLINAESVSCPKCLQPQWKPCVRLAGPYGMGQPLRKPHNERFTAAREQMAKELTEIKHQSKKAGSVRSTKSQHKGRPPGKTPPGGHSSHG